ncbi:YhgE/Pip family protein [Cellulomonas sp. P22]|uniref:YhgE/Pip family protein n=1 Tax=Cellulomonas sp. P22 TaxID=3373189 RepID=UPI0037B8C749
MLSLTSTGTELRRFRRGRLPRLAVAAMILVPLLYGALYLWAFWDPTGNMDRLPVALVNADQGAELDGEPLHAGTDVTTRLLQSGDLDWAEVDADEAADGVADGTYYFAVTVPEDFSADIASAGGDTPTTAQLLVTYNDANSFLASTLGRSAMTQIQSAVSTTIGEQAVDKVLVGLGSARDGFAQASDGALTLRAAGGQLAEGAHQVADGATSAAAGASALADGSQQLVSGSASLADGSRQVATGAGALATGASSAADGAARLSTGAQSLAEGAATAASSSTTLAGGAAEVAAGVHTTVTQVGGLTGKLPALQSGLTQVGTYLGARAAAGDTTAAQLLTGLQQAQSGLPSSETLTSMSAQLARLDAGAGKVATGASALSTGLGTLSDGADELATGSRTLADGTAQVADGARSLATGAGALATGSSTLASGTTTLAAGADALATGTSELADGAGQVADGSDQLGEGTQTLADALAGGADAIPDDDASLRSDRAEVISAPVSVQSDHVAAAEGFGEGFAPFFIPLALFVGSLITWLLLRPLPSRALATRVSGLRVALAGYLPALLIGLGQVLVMLGVTHYGVGLEMHTAAGTVAFTLLIVAAFLALQQMLTAVLGAAAGKVMILALLMLQLASSGGTYPVETTPLFFRVIHPLLPMSYAVTGLRQVITGGVDARLWGAVAYLGALLIGSLAVTAWRAGRLRTWSLARLHPALEI